MNREALKAAAALIFMTIAMCGMLYVSDLFR